MKKDDDFVRAGARTQEALRIHFKNPSGHRESGGPGLAGILVTAGLAMTPTATPEAYCRPPATAPSWKIGRNMAMTMPPTTTPRKTMSSGSISEVSAATVASISVS